MYGIKREAEEVLCHGCLSSDRRLSPLTDYEMFFTLIGNKQSLEEHKFLSIRLCWECQALLRRAQSFRRRLLCAQFTLSSLHVAQAQEISTNRLSSLQFKHKQDYDCTIEESIEPKPDLDSFIDNELNTEIDIKEEFDADDYENDIPNVEQKEIQPVKKRKSYKKDREKLLEKIDSGFDFIDPDKYFSEVCLSEKEVEEVLAREREEDISRPHKCESCGFQFESKTELYNHNKNNHRVRVTKGKCSHCSYAYRSQWELELHCWRAHAVGRCALCGHVVAQARERRRHLERHRWRYRCVKCATEFDNKKWFMYHEKQLHSKYVCDHCSHVAASKEAIEKHMIRHHLPGTCSCGLRFPTWERLRRHARAAHARPAAAAGPAYCVECDVTFATRAKYTRHLSQAQRHRPRKKISVPCPECGKIFSRRNYMNNHMKLFHSNQSRHHCQLCDKYFVTGFSLRSHNKYVHEKIPMPKTKMCSVCGRGFTTNRVLENHMRTHTGERPFACAHCAAAFAQRVALKAHLAAIHKEK